MPLASMFLIGLLLSSPAPWPTKAWSHATPEAEGMNRGALDAHDAEFASGRHGYVDGLLIVRRGCVLYEKTYRQDYDKLFAGRGAPGIYNSYDPGWHPYYERTDLHTMQSVSKSVTSALVGIAIRRGEIPGVDVKLMPYFTAFQTRPDPRRGRMTLRDVLTMTAGIRWDEESTEYTDPANNCAVMEGREDWAQYVLHQPMAEEPGKVFVYNSGATQLLSQLILEATRKPADALATSPRSATSTSTTASRPPEEIPEVAGGSHISFSPDGSRVMDVVAHKALWVSPLSGGAPEIGLRIRRPGRPDRLPRLVSRRPVRALRPLRSAGRRHLADGGGRLT